jgi:hypothetical protein
MTSLSRATSDQRVARFVMGDDTATKVPFLVIGASLALAIAVIHLQDQGGIPGDQSPVWLQYGFYMVELSGTVSAALIIRGKTLGWLLGLASSIGPMTGYVLSRTIGLPGDAGDVGNWGYVLGTVSLIVEGSFVVLAVICLLRVGRTWQPNRHRQASISHRPQVTLVLDTAISAIPQLRKRYRRRTPSGRFGTRALNQANAGGENPSADA